MKSIRLSAAALMISLAILVASAGEVQAVRRDNAFCESGRCIRAIGYAVIHDDRYGGCSLGSAIFMLDLAAGSVGVDIDTKNWGHFSWRIGVDIIYSRFQIRAAHTTDEGTELYADMMLGLPGYARMSLADYEYGTSMWFAGFASFYNKMEPD